jgi:hypothetical protein
MKLRVFTRITPLGIEQALRDMEQHVERRMSSKVLKAQVNVFADDSGVLRDRRAHEDRASTRTESSLNSGRQPLFRQLHTVAIDSREADFQGISLRTHSLHLHGFPRGLRRRNHRLGSEVERNTRERRHTRR